MRATDFIESAATAVSEFLRPFPGLLLTAAGPPRESWDGEDPPVTPEATAFGSIIRIEESPAATWELCLFCDQTTFMCLAREMFGLPPQESPEHEEAADALGETVNVAAGSLKTAIVQKHQVELSLGLPCFLPPPQSQDTLAERGGAPLVTLRGRRAQLVVLLVRRG